MVAILGLGGSEEKEISQPPGDQRTYLKSTIVSRNDPTLELSVL